MAAKGIRTWDVSIESLAFYRSTIVLHILKGHVSCSSVYLQILTLINDI